MSGVVGPSLAELAVGLGAEVAVKTSVPLALGLVASWLPGSTASRHTRLLAGVAAAPVLAGWLIATRGADAAWADAPLWPLVLWALGAVLVGGGLLRAVVRLRRLRLRSAWDGTLVCAELDSPVTAGWWRPKVIVPEAFAEWPAAHRAAALAHEQAHIRRRDWLVHMALWCLAVPLWWHPLLFVSRQRLHLLAECAADDAVLGAGHDPVRYAEQLLVLGRGRPLAALALGSSPVAHRVRHVLRPGARRGASLLSATLTVAVVLTSAVFVAPPRLWSEPAPVVLDCLPADGDVVEDLGPLIGPEPLPEPIYPYLVPNGG